MFKRAIPLLLVLLLATACGFGDQTPTSVPAQATATTAAATATSAAVVPSATTAPQAPSATMTIALQPTATTAAALPSPSPTRTVAALPTVTKAPTSTLPTTPPIVNIEPSATPLAGKTATADLTPAATPATTSAPADPTVLAEIDQIESDTSSLRGLDPKTDVPEHFSTQQEMAANLERETRADYTAEDSAEDALVLWLARLLDERDTDLLGVQIGLLGEQVIGYYDPEVKELYVRLSSGDLDPESRLTLAHEYTHALQDQHYDLQKLRPQDLNDDDRVFAATALVEGDATLSGLLYAQQYMSQDEFQQLLQGSDSGSTDALDSAPAYIRESLLFPYVQGASFVTQLLQNGFFSAVDDALADPPTSTEQIIHPEKYLSANRDEPVAVALTPLTATLGADWAQVDQNTLGEFDLQIMLRENGVTDYEQAAAGWGGTSYSVYRSGEDALLYIASVWDSTKDAREFETAVTESLDSVSKDGDIWSDGDRFFALDRDGDAVTLISGTKSDAVEAALGATK